MAIFFLDMKHVSRASGRSAVAAAAYRSGEKLQHHAEKLTHDYTRRSGVAHKQILVPSNGPPWTRNMGRSELWNLAEKRETRINARTAHELIVALPHELDEEARKTLALTFAAEVADHHGVIVDVALHQPHRRTTHEEEGDEADKAKNHHAHILLTTREVSDEGLGEKVRDLPHRDTLLFLRKRWANLTNEHLKAHGLQAHIDHRTLIEQGIDREPQEKLGVERAAMLRRGETPASLADENPEIDPFEEVGNKQLMALRSKISKRSDPEPSPKYTKARSHTFHLALAEGRACHDLEDAQAGLNEIRGKNRMRTYFEETLGISNDEYDELCQNVLAAEEAHDAALGKMTPEDQAAVRAKQELDAVRAELVGFQMKHRIVKELHEEHVIESWNMRELEAKVEDSRKVHEDAVQALKRAARRMQVQQDAQERKVEMARAEKRLEILAIDEELALRSMRRALHDVERAQNWSTPEKLPARVESRKSKSVTLDERGVVPSQSPPAAVSQATSTADIRRDSPVAYEPSAVQPAEAVPNIPVALPPKPEDPIIEAVLKALGNKAAAGERPRAPKRHASPVTDFENELARISERYRKSPQRDVLDAIKNDRVRDEGKLLRERKTGRVSSFLGRNPDESRRVEAAIDGRDLHRGWLLQRELDDIRRKYFSDPNADVLDVVRNSDRRSAVKQARDKFGQSHAVSVLSTEVDKELVQVAINGRRDGIEERASLFLIREDFLLNPKKRLSKVVGHPELRRALAKAEDDDRLKAALMHVERGDPPTYRRLRAAIDGRVERETAPSIDGVVPHPRELDIEGIHHKYAADLEADPFNLIRDSRRRKAAKKERNKFSEEAALIWLDFVDSDARKDVDVAIKAQRNERTLLKRIERTYREEPHKRISQSVTDPTIRKRLMSISHDMGAWNRELERIRDEDPRTWRQIDAAAVGRRAAREGRARPAAEQTAQDKAPETAFAKQPTKSPELQQARPAAIVAATKTDDLLSREEAEMIRETFAQHPYMSPFGAILSGSLGTEAERFFDEQFQLEMNDKQRALGAALAFLEERGAKHEAARVRIAVEAIEEALAEQQNQEQTQPRHYDDDHSHSF